MLRKLQAHFRHQFIGYLALFVALGGTAYAAATIGSSDIQNNAVRSRHIKDGEVKNHDLAANSVGTGKVIDGSLLKQDFKAGQLPKGDPGPGALQFDVHINAGTSGQPAFGPVNGIRAIAYCNYGDSKVRVYLVQSLNYYIYVSGNESHDTTLVPVNFSGARTSVALTGTYGDGRPGGSQSVDLDVVARSSEVLKYTHFVLGTSNVGAGGCDFWGVITPPSN
jgi:hypothetical protein